MGLKRRDFIKSALLIVAAATAAPMVLEAAWEDVQTSPEIKLILDTLPQLTPDERAAIAKFILSQMENDNWNKVEEFNLYIPSQKDIFKLV